MTTNPPTEQQIGRRRTTGRGTCSECGRRYQLLGGIKLTVRAHKKAGQPDRARWCVGSGEPPAEFEEYWVSDGELHLVRAQS